MSLLDIAMTKIAVLLSTGFLLGLLASYWPFQIIIFLRNNKWYLLVAALASAIIPIKTFFSKSKRKSKKKKIKK